MLSKLVEINVDSLAEQGSTPCRSTILSYKCKEKSYMKKPKFKLSFYKNWGWNWLPYFYYNKLLWKDKFETPRCEHEPQFDLKFLWFGIFGIWGDDNYWEQWLWIKYYCDGDIKKAKETWGWTDMKNKSTWKDDII